MAKHWPTVEMPLPEMGILGILYMGIIIYGHIMYIGRAGTTSIIKVICGIANIQQQHALEEYDF